MSELKYSVIPTFNDIADSAIAANVCLTDDAIQKVSRNAKFGAVRCEVIFMGFYKNGDTIPAVISPVDGFSYAAANVVFDFALYCTRAPGTGFVSGQANPPGIAVIQPANLFWWLVNISNAGVVSLLVSYINQAGAESPGGGAGSTDGIVKVFAIGQRPMALAAAPTFVDVQEDLLVVSQPLRVGRIQDVSHNAKYGAVRHEVINQGFYAGGVTVPTPVSPIDGYAYARAEIRYKAILVSTLVAAGGFTNGQATFPTLGAGTVAKRTGQGPLYWWLAHINDATGLTASTVSYYLNGGAETIHTNDGIFKVLAICQRQSTNV